MNKHLKKFVKSCGREWPDGCFLPLPPRIPLELSVPCLECLLCFRLVMLHTLHFSLVSFLVYLFCVCLGLPARAECVAGGWLKHLSLCCDHTLVYRLSL